MTDFHIFDTEGKHSDILQLMQLSNTQDYIYQFSAISISIVTTWKRVSRAELVQLNTCSIQLIPCPAGQSWLKIRTVRWVIPSKPRSAIRRWTQGRRISNKTAHQRLLKTIELGCRSPVPGGNWNCAAWNGVQGRREIRRLPIVVRALYCEFRQQKSPQRRALSWAEREGFEPSNGY